MSYSPHLRTAVLLTGSGTGGAYHAGVLRALHEAGVKIDVMSGRGVGVAGALFSAIDAAPRTWEEGGLWRRRPGVQLYQWRPALQWAAILAVTAIAMLAIPLVVLATGLIAYPLAFLVQMVNVDAGYRLANAYAALIRDAFSPDVLPTIIPRAITIFLAASFGVLAVSALAGRPQLDAPSRRDPGRWWTRLIGSPWSTEPALRHFSALLWQLFRGPAAARQPPPAELGRRYAELLLDNLGQPGFRELIVATLDLETRIDLIFAGLRPDRRTAFFQRGRGDLIDLSGAGGNHVLDALGGALSIPVLTNPHPVAFSPESYWKGETHRTSDRVAAVARLLHELHIAGVEQVIVVCADSDRAAPHRLGRPIGSLRARVGEQLSAAEIAAVRDGVTAHRAQFRGVFLIQPAHNPIGPLDFAGTYDERSDRFQGLGELIDRGYEDAYRQFIEPVVGGGE